MDFSQFRQAVVNMIQRPVVAWCGVVVLVGLLLWIAITSVQRIWFAPPELAPAVIVTSPQGPSVETISTMHLFGASAMNLNDLPLASLGLQVQGIFLNVAKGESRVLIGMAGQASQMYNVGDMLPGNVKIFKITRDSVIVSHNNQLEKLPFALQGIDFNTTSSTRGLF